MKTSSSTELKMVAENTASDKAAVDKKLVEGEEREQFASTLEFFFSTLGYAGKKDSWIKLNLKNLFCIHKFF